MFRLFSILMLSACSWAAAQTPGGGFIDEARVGLFQHDTGIVGTQKERGADIGLELVFASPAFLQPFHAPRPVVGILVNSLGQTNQIYTGLTDQIALARGIFAADDRIFLRGTIAAGANDGKRNVLGTPLADRWKSHGSAFDFHEAIELGYGFSRHWSASVAFSHTSNAGLAPPNQGMNDIGLWVSRGF